MGIYGYKEMKYKMPPIIHNSEGKLRKVGIELEFGGISLDEAAACVIETFGGTLTEHNHFLMEVKDSRIGTFHLKMDSRDLTEQKYHPTLKTIGINPENETIENIVETVSSIIVPYEVDSPPVDITEIEKIDQLRMALFNKKAQGANASIFNVYATHVNAELPKMDTFTLLKYTRAFLILYPWLYEKSEISLGRKIAHFIRPFPEEYIKLVLKADYEPDFDTFVNDYHEHNPNRNRPLDLYPVLSCIGKDKIDSLPDIGKCSPRPALHYRLPNSQVNESEWSLANVWNLWVEVEKLASSDDDIRMLSKEYLEIEADTYFSFEDKWSNHIKTWASGRQ
jgi:hypothetical protein